MRGIWTSMLVAAVLALGASTLQAQLGDDPAVAKMKKALESLGKGARLRGNGQFQTSRRRWIDQGREIEAALKDQKVALDSTDITRLNAAKTLYASRANTRGRAVDHYLHGRLLGLTNELEAAYDQFKAALAQDVYFYWAWDGMGVYHTRKGEWALAREAFSRVLQLNPDHRKAAFGIVQAYTSERNVDKAVSTLLEIVSNNGRKLDISVEREARLQLARLFRQQSEPAKAIDELTWLTKNGADVLQVRALRARCYRMLERWADAIQDYRRMLQLDPRDYRVHTFIARCYIELGRNADAIREFRKALEVGRSELDPNTVRGLNDAIIRLEKLPAVQNPETKKGLSLDDIVARAKNSPDLRKRRAAIIRLSSFKAQNVESTDVIQKVLGAFLVGVRDSDHVVRAVSLRTLVRNMAGTQKDENIRGLVGLLASGEKHAEVRAMAYGLLGTWRDRYVMPTLLMGLRKESDAYAFREIHETMNRVSLAWVERIPPEELSSQDMARIRSKWESWYRKNRDAYRKYEPENFNS